MAGKGAILWIGAAAGATLAWPCAAAAAPDVGAKRPYRSERGVVTARVHGVLPSNLVVRASARRCGTRPLLEVRSRRRRVLLRRVRRRPADHVSTAVIAPGRKRVTARLVGRRPGSACARSLRVRRILLRPVAPSVVLEQPGPARRASIVTRGRVKLGAAIRTWPIEVTDPRYRRTFLSNFDSLTPENEMKWFLTEPRQGQFDLRAADRMVQFAERNGKEVRGHTLVWHFQLPSWLEKNRNSRDELLAALELHVKTLAGAFRGRVDAWDVVNEPIHDDGYLLPNLWLSKIGPQYIEMALRWARQADPHARLFINEYGTEKRNAKSDALYRLASDLVRRGVPLDGIGFQMHVSTVDYPSAGQLSDNLKRFTALGLDVEITELDVESSRTSGSPENRATAQANVFAQAASACVAVVRCTKLTTWGFSDAVSWLRPESRALPFDSHYRAKSGWYPLLTVSRAP